MQRDRTNRGAALREIAMREHDRIIDGVMAVSWPRGSRSFMLAPDLSELWRLSRHDTAVLLTSPLLWAPGASVTDLLLQMSFPQV